MATLTHSMTPTVSSSSKGFGASFFAKLAEKRRMKATINALEALTDHELRDIGLTRGDISEAAHNGRKAA
nr:DUF1127 domain-containing protein [uncultured Celeribacter sp.]